MVLGLAALAVVVALGNVAFRRKAHTRPMLPCHAELALDHEAAIVLWKAVVSTYRSLRGGEKTYRSPHKHSA